MPGVRQQTNFSQLKAHDVQLERLGLLAERYFADDHLEARYAAARAQVDKLTSATLAKAFHCELVPQDPNDEPPASCWRAFALGAARTPRVRQSGAENEYSMNFAPMQIRTRP